MVPMMSNLAMAPKGGCLRLLTGGGGQTEEDESLVLKDAQAGLQAVFGSR